MAASWVSAPTIVLASRTFRPSQIRTARMRAFILSSTFAGAALAAANGPYAQCGGNGWAGESTCVDGYTCTFSNDWYSQCLPGSASAPAPAPTTSAPATTMVTSTKTTAAGAPTSTSSGKFKWFGINQSVAEFGEKNLPGVWGKDFYFPSDETIAVSSPLPLI